MKKRMALWLWRLALRLLKPTKEKPVGIPYQRDPDSPCDFYEPSKRGQWTFGDCETDGHYLCGNCCHRHEAAKEAGSDGVKE